MVPTSKTGFVRKIIVVYRQDTYTKYFNVCFSQKEGADFGNFFEGTQMGERSFKGRGTNLG